MDWGLLASTALGGIIAALTAYWTQRWTIADSLAREDRATRRIDTGVSRQLRALYRDLQQMILVTRRQGVYDLRKWEPVFERVSERIYQPDVAVALTDDQAENVYAMAFTARLAIAVLTDLDRDFNASQPPRDAAELQERAKATLTPAWLGFRGLWESFYDNVRLQEWREWNEEIDAAGRARRD